MVKTHDNNNSSTASVSDASVARIREVTAKLRAAGITQPEALIRFGAAVMVERCLAKYEERKASVGLGWLAAAVRKGDAHPELVPQPRRESPSELLVAIEEVGVAG